MKLIEVGLLLLKAGLGSTYTATISTYWNYAVNERPLIFNVERFRQDKPKIADWMSQYATSQQQMVAVMTVLWFCQYELNVKLKSGLAAANLI